MNWKAIAAISLIATSGSSILYGMERNKNKVLKGIIKKQNTTLQIFYDIWSDSISRAWDTIPSTSKLEHLSYVMEQLEFCVITRTISQENYLLAMADLNTIFAAIKEQ